MSRNLPNERLLLDTLAAEEHINITHLIRVELPGTTKYSKDYSYISDGLYPIEYEGNIYQPKYVSSVGDVTEITDAKKSTTSLVLDATAIHQEVGVLNTVTFAPTSLTYAATDLEAELVRFTPGDKISFSSGSNAGLSVSVLNVRTLSETLVGVSFQVEGSFGVVETVQSSIEYSLPRQELRAFVDSNSTTSFNKYINKKVTIYRQYADRNNTVLSTFVLFEGLIAKGSFQETETKTTMTWSLDSNWANFTSIVGRKSTDSHHREALSGYLLRTNRILKSREYVKDLGFMHAEAAINVLAQFMTPVEKLVAKKKKKWTGSKTKYRLETVYEESEVKVNFNLAAEYIPIIYGVNKVKPNIVFADLLTAPQDFSVLATAQVLCEGPIAGILDIYSDEKSHICLDAVDSETRGLGSPFVAPADAYTCYYRADAGDTLKAWRSVSPKATGIEATVSSTTNSSTTLTLDAVSAGTLMSYSYLDVPYTVELGNPTSTTSEYVNFTTTDTFVVPPEDTAVTLQTPEGKILKNFIAPGTTSATAIKLYNPLVLGGLGDFVAYAGAPENLKIISTAGAGSITLNQAVSLGADTTVSITKPVGEYNYASLNTGPSHFISSSANGNSPLLDLAGITDLRAPRDWRSNKQSGQFFSDGMGISIDTLAETYLFNNGGETQKASPLLSRIGTSYVDGSQVNPTVFRGSAILVATDKATQDLREKLTPGFTYVVTGCTNEDTSEDDYTRSLLGATFSVATIKDVVHAGTSQVARVEKAFFTREALQKRKPTKRFKPQSNKQAGQKKIETAKYQVWESEYKYYTAKNLTPTIGADPDIHNSTYVPLILTLTEASSAGFLYQGPEKTREVTDVRINQIKFTDVQKGFKTQDAFFDTFPIDYWGESHILRDTAYITNLNKITYDDSETEIPEYVVQGKFINCHSYDNSYTVTDAREIDSMYIGQEVVIAGAEARDMLAIASKKLSDTQTIQLIAVKINERETGIQVGYLNVGGTQTDSDWPEQVLDGTAYPLSATFETTNPNNDDLLSPPKRYSAYPEDIQDIHWDGTFLFVLDLIGIGTYIPPTNLISGARPTSLPSLQDSWRLVGHTRIWGPAAPRKGDGRSLLDGPNRTENWPRIPLSGAVITEGQEVSTTLTQTRSPTSETISSATEVYVHQKCYFDAQNIDRISIGDEVYRGAEYLGLVLGIGNQDDVDWNFYYGRGWDWTNVFGESQFKDAPYPALSTVESRWVIIESSQTISQNDSLTFRQRQIEVFVPSTGLSTWSDSTDARIPTPAHNLWAGYMYDRTDAQILVYDKTLLTRVTTPAVEPEFPKTLTGRIGSPYPQTSQYYVNTSEDRNHYSTLAVSNSLDAEFWVEGSYGNWQCLAPYIGLNYTNTTFNPRVGFLLQNYTEVIDNGTAGPDFTNISRGNTFESTYHPPTKVITQADNPTLPDRVTAFSVIKDEVAGTWRRNFIQDHKNNFYGRNKLPTGMTSDGTTVWVADWIMPPSVSGGDKKESVWRHSVGHPLASEYGEFWAPNSAQKVDVTTHNKFYGTGKIYAYNATTLVREPSLDINTHSTLALKDSATTKTVSKIENALPRTLELSNLYDKQFDEDQHSSSFHASSYSQASTSVLHVADVTGIEIGDTITFPVADTDSYIRPCLFSASHDPAWTKSALRPANNSAFSAIPYLDTPTDKQYDYTSFPTLGGRPAPDSQTAINNAAGPQRYRHAFQHDLIHVARVASVHPESNTVFVNKYVEMDLTQNTQVIFSKDQSYFNGRVYEEAYPPAAFPYLAPNKYEFGGTTYPQYEQFDFNLRTKAPMPYDIHVQGVSGSADQVIYVLNKGESHARTLNEQYTQRDAVEYIDKPFKHDLSYVTVFDVTTKKPTGKTIWLGHDSVGICADSDYLYSLEERAPSVISGGAAGGVAVRTLTYTLNSYNISGLGNGTDHRDYVDRVDDRILSTSPLYYKHTNYQAPGLVEAAAANAYGSWVSSFAIPAWSTLPAALGTFKHGLAIDPETTSTRNVANTYNVAEGPYTYPYFTTIEQGGGVDARVINEIGNRYNLGILGSDTKALSAFTFDPAGKLLAVGGADPIRSLPYNEALDSLDNKARIYEKELYVLDYGVLSSGGASQPDATATTSGLLGGAISESGDSLLIESGTIAAATSARYERDDSATVYVPQTLGVDEVTIKSISALSYGSTEGNVFAFLGNKKGWAGYNYRPTNTAPSWDDITTSVTSQYHTAFEDVTATATNKVTKIQKRRNIEGTMEYAISLESPVVGVPADSYRVAGAEGSVSVKSRYIYPTILSPNQLGAEDPLGPSAVFTPVLDSSGNTTSAAEFSKPALGSTAAILAGIDFEYLGTPEFQEFFMLKIPSSELVYSSNQAKFDAGWDLKGNAADFTLSELTLINNGLESTFRIIPSPELIDTDLYDSGNSLAWATSDNLYYVFITPTRSSSFNKNPNLQNTFYNTATFQESEFSFKNMVKLSQAEASLSSKESISFLYSEGLAEGQVVEYDTANNFAILQGVSEGAQSGFDAFTKYKLYDSTSQDFRVSTNPALQLLDYLRSGIYGRDLDIHTDLDLDSFLEAARACDAPSGVTLVVPAFKGTTNSEGFRLAPPTTGDKYNIVDPVTRVTIIFEGTVAGSTLIEQGGNSYYQIDFINVIGKLGKKYNRWQKLGLNYVWDKQGNIKLSQEHPADYSFYDMADITGPSVGGSGTWPILRRVSGVGAPAYYVDIGTPVYTVTHTGTLAQGALGLSVTPSVAATISVGDITVYGSDVYYVTDTSQPSLIELNKSGTAVPPTEPLAGRPQFYTGDKITFLKANTQNLDSLKLTSDNNPLVKQYRESEGSFGDTGYSLYDCDNVKYWKYLGWEDQAQEYVTRHQTNLVIDTSKSSLEITNDMLSHFNGILRYSNGLYSLAVKSRRSVAWRGDAPDLTRAKNIPLTVNSTAIESYSVVDFVETTPSIYRQGDTITFPDGQVASIYSTEYVSGFALGSSGTESSYIQPGIVFEHPTAEAPADGFGALVVVDGDTLATSRDGLQGGVAIYKRVNGLWALDQELDGLPVGWGRSLVLSGDTLLVGHPEEPSPGGAVYIWTRNANGTWTNSQSFITETNTVKFGAQMAYDGTKLVVSDPLFDNGVVLTPGVDILGSLFVYTGSGSTWTLEQKIDGTNYSHEKLGLLSVAIDGDLIAAGSPGSGGGYVNTYVKNSAWVEAGTLTSPITIAPGSGGAAQFGKSLVLEGTELFVGMPGHIFAGGGSNRNGSVHLYSYTGTAWGLSYSLTPPATTTNYANFGWSIAKSGDNILIGAPKQDNALLGSGAAYYYKLIGGTWVEVQEITEPLLSYGNFGFSVGISGSFAAVSSPSIAGRFPPSSYTPYRSNEFFAGTEPGHVRPYLLDQDEWVNASGTAATTPVYEQSFQAFGGIQWEPSSQGLLRLLRVTFQSPLSWEGSEDNRAVTFTPLRSYRDIQEEDIIGSIKVSDKGAGKQFNSISATILDPQAKFSGRDISFFNSQYLEEDSYIPKEGNFNQPGITNYFNARMNVKQALDSSRYSLTVELTVVPHLITLVAGEIITLTKGSYEWDRKEFRISKIVLLKNGTIRITAEEHTDQTYCLTAENTITNDSLLSSALPNTSNSQAF